MTAIAATTNNVFFMTASTAAPEDPPLHVKPA
jgi:hypothetical protein